MLRANIYFDVLYASIFEKFEKKIYLHVKNISVNVHEDGLFMITAEFCIKVHILLKSGLVTEHLQCIAVFIYF